MSFKRKPIYVGVDDTRVEATREGLEQGYCVTPSTQRFLLLFTFLKRNLKKKVGPCVLLLGFSTSFNGFGRLSSEQCLLAPRFDNVLMCQAHSVFFVEVPKFLRWSTVHVDIHSKVGPGNGYAQECCTGMLVMALLEMWLLQAM